MTFKERVETYTTARDTADKALRRYMKTQAKAEELKAQWEQLTEAATQALKGLRDEDEQA